MSPRLPSRSPTSYYLLGPCAISFLAGSCIMVVELVASRLVAGFLGQSLYIWSGVIGVILGGIALGSTVGGELADRYDSKKLVATLLAISGVLVAVTPFVVNWIGAATHEWDSSQPVWIARIVTVILISFLLPGTALGTIPPALAKWGLDARFATGQTVGLIYASNNAGSILGTFFAGFYLMATVSLNQILWVSAIGLGLLALLFVPFIKKQPSAPSALALAASSDSALARGNAAPSSATSGLFLPAFLIFLAGFGVMMIELAISRFVAQHLGQSLFTWTSVIGVVLAGISVGNTIGGWLADRFDARRLIGPLLFFASIASVGILPAQHLSQNAQYSWMSKLTEPLAGTIWSQMGPSATWGFRVFCAIFSAFFVSSMVLGMMSPVVVKWTLDSGRATGRTVGTLYAINTLGAITGTFATGFFLLGLIRVSPLVMSFGLFLSIVSLGFLLIYGPRLGTVVGAVWCSACIVLLLLAAAPSQGFRQAVLAVVPVSGTDSDDTLELADYLARCDARVDLMANLLGRQEEIDLDETNPNRKFRFYDESNYYSFQVSDSWVTSAIADDYLLDSKGNVQKDKEGFPEPNRRRVRQLVLDHLVHGYLDLTDFKYLHYEYEHIYANISHRLLHPKSKRGEPLHVLFLGGGSYTFPRYLSEYYPNIDCDVLEIDPKVTEIVQKTLGLNKACGKTFYLLGGNAKPEKEGEEKDKSVIKDEPSLLRAFTANPRNLTPKQRYARILLAAGAKEADSPNEEGIDYAIDLRPLETAPPNDETSAVKELEQHKVPILTMADFDKLLAETSHPNIHSHHMDARQWVMRYGEAGKYDIIYGDAFNNFSVPAHLTTLEFTRELARLLKPDGVFMVNVIDRWSVSHFLGSYANTFREVFPYVYIYSTSFDKPSDVRETFVIVGSLKPLDLEELGKREGEIAGLGGALLTPEWMIPVERGGRWPQQSFLLVAPGGKEELKLPAGLDVTAADLRVVRYKEGKQRALEPGEYEVAGGKLTLKNAPAKGTRFLITVYGKEKVLLTDQFSPVDNFLSEVISSNN